MIFLLWYSVSESMVWFSRPVAETPTPRAPCRVRLLFLGCVVECGPVHRPQTCICCQREVEKSRGIRICCSGMYLLSTFFLHVTVHFVTVQHQHVITDVFNVELERRPLLQRQYVVFRVVHIRVPETEKNIVNNQKRNKKRSMIV